MYSTAYRFVEGYVAAAAAAEGVADVVDGYVEVAAVVEVLGTEKVCTGGCLTDSCI